MEVEEGRSRVVITNVKPEIECGRYPVKRTAGEKVIVEADIFADGHDAVSAAVLYRKQGAGPWIESPMELLANDRWRGQFLVSESGVYEYCLEAWVDRFKSWRRDLQKKAAAGQDIQLDLLIGAGMIEENLKRVPGAGAQSLKEWGRDLRQSGDVTRRIALALSEDLAGVMERYPAKHFASRYQRVLTVRVDRERARFSAWYEMFPRSCAPEAGRHGTLKNCERRLPYVASMGFDVLYLPPIHPIGRSFRKGKNNAVVAGPGDPGSPWAIGAEEGGHKAIHPQLGTLEDFRQLVRKAKENGLEIALDLAYQCSPDHPYVKEHPEWFRHRPDGTIQYAENPPKKYQDIYPFDFETDHWKELWDELKSIVLFWIEQGVRIFRVDNPHTKPLPFWGWLIQDIQRDWPDVIFLAEAFTRPKVMYQLAKLGFTQSYTYFTWRNTKPEITEYFTDLAQTEVREFFRPSLWPNTPDILTEYLQFGGRQAFITRLILAATLGASYGIYGPAFELIENRARESRSEEYLDSEKYEIRSWDTGRPDSLRHVITRVNQIRRENPALQSDANLRFHTVGNEQMLCYSKHSEDGNDIVLVVVNLDPHHTQAGWVEIPLADFGISPEGSYQAHDALSDVRYLWHGARNYVELKSQELPAHIFRLRRRVRREEDFDYYM